ncbi:unnamed protein product [Lymnaea stagnalis]|uniref:Peptidase M12B domain-containing protein n=1 Tax=Lymnaea stagnalis TaxID=6523 RepID=A0AAV2I863_LYMST
MFYQLRTLFSQGHASVVVLLPCFLFIHTCLVGNVTSKTVRLHYTSRDVTNRTLPDDVTVTLSTGTGSNSSTVCHLKRAKHINLSTISVYTLSTDPDGKVVQRKEDLPSDENIGFYQDPETEAIFQITRTNGRSERKAHLKLQGNLRVGHTKFSVKQDHRVRRDATPLTPSPAPSAVPDELYTILALPALPVVRNDFLEAPPEIKLSVAQSKDVDLFRNSTSSPASSTTATPPSAPSTTATPPSAPSTTATPPSAPSKSRRRRRQTAPTYYIDVAIYVDNGAYRRFLGDAGTRAAAIAAVQQYYAFIFNGVDLRYQGITTTEYRMRVRLDQIVIAETATAATFTESYRVTNKPWDEVDAQRALTTFSEFVTGRSTLLSYDHVMLFTGYDLTSLVESVTTNTTTGLAYTSTMCRTDGKSVSVVEDLGGFQSVDTAAHELGHGLGSRHDGDGNTCSSTDRFIMAGGSSKETDANRLNPWHFSQCSVTAFTTFISNALNSARGRTCLTQSLTMDANLPDVSSRLPGQEFTPDQQCRMIYGSSSRMCRGIEFGSVSGVCTSMFCFDPTTDGTCYEQTAAMGTSCGNMKVCLNGECVYQADAPRLDEGCVFGDQPGVAFDGKTCQQFVGLYNGYCYQEVVRGRCCASCKAVYKPVQACEYGNKATGCSQAVCTRGTTENLKQCCGTCNYGEPLAPTTTVSPIGTKAPSMTTKAVVTTRTTTQSSNPGVISTAPSSSCQDQPDIMINNMSCTTAVLRYSYFCYQSNMRAACCASCKKVNTGISGCEYGDQDPVACISSSCSWGASYCCYTCGQRGAATQVSNSKYYLAVLTVLTFLTTCLLTLSEDRVRIL